MSFKASAAAHDVGTETRKQQKVWSRQATRNRRLSQDWLQENEEQMQQACIDMCLHMCIDMWIDMDCL